MTIFELHPLSLLHDKASEIQSFGSYNLSLSELISFSNQKGKNIRSLDLGFDACNTPINTLRKNQNQLRGSRPMFIFTQKFVALALQ